jgi:hypothetical protein
MMTTGEEYLNELAGFPPKTFPSHFSNSATRLRLCANPRDRDKRLNSQARLAVCSLGVMVWGVLSES